VLATRDGCTADVCDAFGLVYDDKKLRANMRDRLFDVTVARYATNWPARSARPLVSAAPPPSAPTSSGTQAVTPPGPNVSFPSSASIPPVSIMNSEPDRPAPQGQTADAPPPAPTNTAPASATKKAAAPRAPAKSAGAPRPLSLNPTTQQKSAPADDN
jgi:hypothetical protein